MEQLEGIGDELEALSSIVPYQFVVDMASWIYIRIIRILFFEEVPN